MKSIRWVFVTLSMSQAGCPGCVSAEECAKACGDQGISHADGVNVCECNPCGKARPPSRSEGPQ
jgi:hypothetical protein